MLTNFTAKNINPIPAYDTTRYNGAINLQENGNKYFVDSNQYSPRSTNLGFPSTCTKIDKWSKKESRIKKIIEIIEKEDIICNNSTKSSILSICRNVSKESSHCTCKDEICTCLIKKKTLSKVSSICYPHWTEIYNLTDTSDTKLVESFEKLCDYVENSENTNIYFDLLDPYPREEQQIKGKNPPSGYNVTLILPQCLCCKNFKDNNKIELKKSKENSDEKLQSITNLLCISSIMDLSWDIMQSGIIEKIPEKYTTSIFENKKVKPTNSENSKVSKDVDAEVDVETDSHTTYCLHKIFLEKLNKFNFLM